MIVAMMLASAPLTERIDRVAASAGLAGVVLVGKGDRVIAEKGYGSALPGGQLAFRPESRWRLASITKQVVATLAMEDVAAGRLSLDAPVADRLGVATLGPITLRQLLTHRSGLPNPDTTPAEGDGFPAFYRAAAPDVRYCEVPIAAPGGAFSYNNCDYILIGALLDKAGARRLDRRWPRGMRLARAGDRLVSGTIAGKPEPAFTLASFGASGALTGTARDVWAFDRTLMTGKALPSAARELLWQGDPKLGYQALGQWVFPGSLKGCAAPKRIVQRDGEIGGVQTRNFILPDDDLVVVVFTNRGSDDFQFGEIWQQKGFAYDLLSAVVCT